MSSDTPLGWEGAETIQGGYGNLKCNWVAESLLTGWLKGGRFPRGLVLLFLSPGKKAPDQFGYPCIITSFC